MSISKLNSEESTDNKGIVSVALSKIIVNGFNPRKTFAENELMELADSIRQVGVLQPVLVRKKGKKFEIVCGERRFRACTMAGLETIPAIVRKLTDDEALEIAITENLQRKDISIIEEATAYKRLADTGRYDVASLAVRFGKSEAYIRNRIKLNDLTENMLRLVNDEILSITVALELCKYSVEIQADIYEKHLSENPAYHYNWRNLKAKEFIKCLENKYWADLSRFRFDKSACAQCPLNTNAYTLFPESEGKCTDLTCLQEKNPHFLVDTCKEAMNDNPAIEITQSPYRCNTNEEVFVELSEQGYMLNECSLRSFPEAPEMPEREQFEELKDYEEAIEEYNSMLSDYATKNEEVENLISVGKAKVMLTVEDNEVIKGYAILPENEVQISTTTNEVDAVQKLEKQDRRNREIAVENIVDDTKKLIRETEIPQSDFTEFEDKLLYFVMLEDVKREHFVQLDISHKNWHLSDEDKIKIINNMTEEQKTLIRRDFLVKHLSNTFGIAKKSYLMLEFARQHFPEALAETENKYNEVYQKRHARITEKLEALKEVQTTDMEIDEVA
jgi:ParB family chromosome partitioning protein